LANKKNKVAELSHRYRAALRAILMELEENIPWQTQAGASKLEALICLHYYPNGCIAVL